MEKTMGWDGILDPGESIIWQGRPVPGFQLTGSSLVMTLFGMVFAGFALFWMLTARSMAGETNTGIIGLFWLFGLPFLAVGLGIVASATVWPIYRQKHTWYSLTRKRAFIATDLPLAGKQLKSYPITRNDPLELVDGPLQSVYFATESHRSDGTDHTVKIGFERLADGREVYRLLRDIRADASDRR
jgi:hypothetical protein